MKEKELFQKLIKMAKREKKTILLPEGEEKRIIQAAIFLQDKQIANMILLGHIEKIKSICEQNGMSFNEQIRVINPDEKEEKRKQYSLKLYELRKKKGMTLQEAEEKIGHPVYYAMMMLFLGEVDGVVGGAKYLTAEMLRPALQIIPKEEATCFVSSFFLMETQKKKLGADGALLFSDCALIEEPTKEQLEDIANASVKSFQKLVGKEPKVAFLSYSSFGSANSQKIEKIQEVVKTLKEKKVPYEVDGEMQLDCAIIKEIAKKKAPNSKIAGNANILIFPNLEAGNIGYKLAQNFGNMMALGPITQGFVKPVNDLSRGAKVEDIIGVVAITCIQAQNKI